MGVRNFYVKGFFFYVSGLGIQWGIELVFLRFVVRDSYVEGLGFLRLVVSNSYVWGFLILSLGVRYSHV